MACVCIGVPYWIGEAQAVSAVEAVRASGIADALGAAWVDVVPQFADDVPAVVAVNRALAEVIAAHPDHTPLIFAADCVSALGALKGLEARRPSVIWYDAHGDFNTPETTPSNFLGGMPLAALVGRGNDWLMAGVGLSPMDERAILITDARDLDPEEGAMLAASALTHLPTVEALLTHPLPAGPVYVHFDTDVVNTDEMPAMNYPAAGGPSLATTLATLERLNREVTIAGVLFSLWGQHNPGADVALAATLRAVRALTAAGA